MQFQNAHISEKLNFTKNILNFNSQPMHFNIKADNTILVILNANFLCRIFIG